MAEDCRDRPFVTSPKVNYPQLVTPDMNGRRRSLPAVRAFAITAAAVLVVIAIGVGLVGGWPSLSRQARAIDTIA